MSKTSIVRILQTIQRFLKFAEMGIIKVSDIYSTSLTLISYQKLKHPFGCCDHRNPGVDRYVVADPASVSFAPAIAIFLSTASLWPIMGEN